MLRRLSLPLGELERQALCADIVRLSIDTPSHASHNQGGWRSPDTWLRTTWLHDRIVRLLAMRPELKADPATIRGWAIVNRKGAFHRSHVHGAAYAWSGIVYLDPGGTPSAATIFEWRETRHAPLSVVRVEPSIGLVVVFPSSLAHRVEEHQGDGTRITVGFDVKAVVRAPS